MSVEVRGLAKRFSVGGAAAVAEVSFTAPGGAITTLLGPSGSGKTTILRLLAGLEEPDAGSIVVEGSDWSRLPARRRKVGLVFQSYALFQHMTVLDNVAFGLRAQGVGRGEAAARAAELLALVQLSKLAKRHPRQLSGGQQQRVALARALAPRPALLLLDEPFAALDAQVRTELRRWLLELHEQTKVTTVLVTHDQQEALELSQHVVVMNHGRVEQAGSPDHLYDHPASPFVASFLGASNRLEGRVEGGLASVGPLSIDAPTGARSGETVFAFVRPHDVELARATGAEQARIERLTRVGGQVKVELRLNSGETMAVQMTRTELTTLGVIVGDPVLINLRDAKVFVGDYVI